MSARVLPEDFTGAPLAVLPGKARRRPRLRAWVLFTAAVVVAFFLLIFSRTALDRTAFEIDDLEAKIAVEETRYWELRLEIARLQAPDRIMEAAETMGLVFPTELKTVEVASAVEPAPSLEERWAALKSLLSAQP